MRLQVFNVSSCRIKDIMLKHVLAANINTSVGTAIKLMQNAQVAILPVLSGSRLAGIVTREQLEKEVQTKRLGDVRLELVFVTEDDTIEKAAKLMVENSLARLPVVSEASSMHCVGIITSTEIAKYHKEKC